MDSYSTGQAGQANNTNIKKQTLFITLIKKNKINLFVQFVLFVIKKQVGWILF